MSSPFRKLPYGLDESVDRRTSPRHKVVKQGAVTCKFSRQDYACRVINLSATGATIETLAHAALSNSVALLVIGENIVYQAEVVWKKETQIGLKFLGEPRRL
jgi:PilZ domain